MDRNVGVDGLPTILPYLRFKEAVFKTTLIVFFYFCYHSNLNKRLYVNSLCSVDNSGFERWEETKTWKHLWTRLSIRRVYQSTKKLDCPATLQVRAVRLYTDYTLSLEEYSSKKSLTKAKASILQELKNDMQKGKILGTVTR